ncbi:MAG: hypothetical protein JNJ46_00830 [Myxococcales bacterium]|nr:hypothetical protein [Myxococcales bacterium]
MTHVLRVREIQDRLRSAVENGEYCASREAYLELLQASKAWLLEVQGADGAIGRQHAPQLAQSLESIATLLNRNEQLVRIDATFLLGERVEIERVEFGLRCVWVPGTVTDFRPAAIRARQLRNPRALDYLVREDDGEERWRADEGIRRRTD